MKKETESVPDRGRHWKEMSLFDVKNANKYTEVGESRITNAVGLALNPERRSVFFILNKT